MEMPRSKVAALSFLGEESDGSQIPAAFFFAPFSQLKPWRILADDAEGFFQRQADLSDQAIIEQAAQDRDAMRDAARRIELGQRVVFIRRPVAARFCNCDETGAQS